MVIDVCRCLDAPCEVVVSMASLQAHSTCLATCFCGELDLELRAGPPCLKTSVSLHLWRIGPVTGLVAPVSPGCPSQLPYIARSMSTEPGATLAG